MSQSDFLLILAGLPMTVLLTGVIFIVGAMLGFPVMLARQSALLPVRILTIAIIALIRSVPPIVWLFIVFFGIGADIVLISPFFSAVIALGAIAAVNMAEIYRGGMISIHHGQWEASTALSLGRFHTFAEIIIPQMFRVSLPTAGTYFIGLLKETSIASTIGVLELTFRGNMVSQMSFRGLEPYIVVGLLYIALSLPVAWLARMADQAGRGRARRHHHGGDRGPLFGPDVGAGRGRRGSHTRSRLAQL